MNYEDFVYHAMERSYGITSLSFEEEINLPATIKQIRMDKINIIDNIEFIQAGLETIKIRTRNTPELNDSKHMKLVHNLRDLVYSILKETEKAVNVGRQ